MQPELLEDSIKSLLSQFDPHMPLSSKTAPPLFDDKEDQARRQRASNHVSTLVGRCLCHADYVAWANGFWLLLHQLYMKLRSAH
jgi:hypothetical protein